jgi:hypothetical protein
VRKLTPVDLKPWTLPFLILALVLPIVVTTLLIGAAGSFIAGAVVAWTIAVVAIRARFDEPIEVPRPTDGRYHLLAVAMKAIEEPESATEIAAVVQKGTDAVAAGSGADAEILVLAPASSRAVDRWASDVEGAREAAQRRLAVSVGVLAAARLDARGLVGDHDPIQAVEDALRTFPAHEVVFVTARGEGDREVSEVRRRLDRPVLHLGEAPSPAIR